MDLFGDAEAEVWEWAGSRISAFTIQGDSAECIVAHPDGALFVIVSTRVTVPRGRHGDEWREKSRRITIQVFSTESWQETDCLQLKSEGRPLAFRVCTNGQIRGVTAVGASGKVRSWRLSFWAFDMRS